MKIKRMFVTLIFGLGLTLGLLWLLSGGQMPRPNVARAAGPHHVAPGGNCGTASPCYATIQAAVDAANPDDVIKVAQGDYTDIHQRGGITQVVYISKTVIVRGGYTTINWDTPDPSAHPTTLDAQGLGRVLVISGTITPTIEGLHITGGDATGLGGWKGDPANYDAGGGVYVYAATPAISRCVIYSNTASTLDRGFGGGLYLEGATALTGNTVQENVASTANYGAGGGMYLRSSDGSTLSGNTLLTNTASTTNTGSGGGVHLYYSDAALTGNTLQGNVASKATSKWGSGGGLYAYLSDVTLVGNTVRGNIGGTTYSAYGGGMYLRGAESTLEGNWIIDNAASQAVGYTGLGGGVYVYKTHVITLINNVVADNYAYHHGSGLYIDSEASSATMAYFLHNTIADNRGGSSGLFIDDHTTALITNTILTGHANTALRVEASSTATLEATLWHGNGSLTFGDGAIISSTNVYSAPGFVDPSTWDYHLNADSAAIDRGVDSDIAMDIDGEARPAGGYDLGADEYHSFGVLLAPNRNGNAVPGAVITYTHTLTNSGNYTDTFALSCSSSQGWALVAPLSVTLAAGGTQQVVVTVIVPAGAAVGVVESTVITAASQAASSIFDTVTDTTTVTRVAGVQLAPDRVGSAAPGTVITYTHTLTNSGNYTDTFALSYSSSQGWASVAPPSITLAAGGTQQVVATVNVPAGAAVGVVESTVITATSQAAPTIFDTVTDTTTVEEYRIYLPLVLHDG